MGNLAGTAHQPNTTVLHPEQTFLTVLLRRHMGECQDMGWMKGPEWPRHHQDGFAGSKLSEPSAKRCGMGE